MTPTEAPPEPGRAHSRDAIRLLWRALQPDRASLRAGAAWLLLAALLEALGPLLGKAFIDQHLVPRTGELPAMVGLLAGAWLAGLAASGLRYLQLMRLASVAMRAVQRIREQVYGHVMRLPMASFDRAQTGQLVSRITNDTEAVKTLYLQVMFVMLDSGIVLLGLFAAMAWLDLRLMAVVSLLLPAVLGIVWLYQRWSAPAVARARALRGSLNAQTAETISGMAVLQATGATAAFGARYAHTNQAHFDARRQELRANAWLLRPALDFLNVALLAGVIAVFGVRHALPASGADIGAGAGLHALEIGLLYAFVSYIARIVEPLVQVTMQFSQLQQAVVAGARVAHLLREPIDAATPGTSGTSGLSASMAATTDAEPLTGQVDFDGVHFAYGDGPAVINGLTLSIPDGSFVGIVGPTGCGKSTLLQLLLRFYAPQQGTVRLGGRAVGSVDDAAFRDAVALVPQDPFLMAASLRENIDLGRGLPEARLVEAAQAAGAADFIARLEHGLDTVLGEGGARLSVGEKQLLALARALAGQPRVLLLDEATAHIDTETEQTVQRSLAALRGRLTLVAIAHRLSTIRDADPIVVLQHGRIAEAGTHAQLVAVEGGLYQRLHELQTLQQGDVDADAACLSPPTSPPDRL